MKPLVCIRRRVAKNAADYYLTRFGALLNANDPKGVMRHEASLNHSGRFSTDARSGVPVRQATR